jgi:hypothetical protein
MTSQTEIRNSHFFLSYLPAKAIPMGLIVVLFMICIPELPFRLK